VRSPGPHGNTSLVRHSVSPRGIAPSALVALLGALLGCASSPPVRPLDNPKPPATPAAADLSLDQATSAAIAGDSSAPAAGDEPVDRERAGWLGVELAAPPAGESGVLVRGVVPDSPAERAGLALGDSLLMIDGTAVSRPRDVIELISARRPGERVAIVLRRASVERLVAATLEPLPNDEKLMQRHYVDQRAPGLSGLTTIQGNLSPSLVSLRGRVVLVEFWATWCVPCHIMAPVLSDWSDRYSARGLDVLGVTGESAAFAADAARRHGMSYPLFADESGATQRAYRAYALPTLFVIDRRGVVRDVMVGFSSERLRAIEGLLERLLAER
jgi:peroxiredoxin